MRMSNHFGQTLREAPSEAEIASHRLLLRAGFIRQLASGIYSYLPLARRAMDKIEAILREEMDAIGGQEMTMPVVQPADIWQETGRWYSIDAEMSRFVDRTGRDLVLAMTHEEVVADLIRREIRSYRQLPGLIYHIQTKWRDDPRPRGGLVRVREFTMKDSYSLDADWQGLDKHYQAHYQAYKEIFRRCGLEVIAVEADSGMMGGQLSHEFMYLSPIGEDTLLLCAICGYAANRQIARFKKDFPPQELTLPIEKVATPDCKSISDLAMFLGVPESRTAKAVFMMATFSKNQELSEKLVFAIVRGDTEVNETKLTNALKARSLRPATEIEIRQSGAQPGYASPVGIKTPPDQMVVIVDELIPNSPNLVAGANEVGYHLLNVNYARDFSADQVTDLTAARSGDGCPECGQPLKAVRGVEVGNIFKLGTRYSETMGCYFSDVNGQKQPVIMGSYGIGVGRLLACIAEAHHDDSGLIWPASVAPFDTHLIVLPGKQNTQAVTSAAEEIYALLQASQIDTLFDDRSESPGVKFNDADLIGLPLRLTISEKNHAAGMVEVKRRAQPKKQLVAYHEVVEFIQQGLSSLKEKF